MNAARPSREVAFQKWEATGNDFLFIDSDATGFVAADLSPMTVRAVCHRQVGVGADGVVFYSGDSDVAMTILNSDGSPGDMCGNALRCLAEILASRDGSREHRVRLAGRTVRVLSSEPGTSSVVMGQPSEQSHLPLFHRVEEWDALVGGPGYLLSFGNPHYVVPLDGIPQDWESRGAALQQPADEKLGTGGINCGFLSNRPDQTGLFSLRVYERGAGATLSCGSGACAASAVLQRVLGVEPPHRLALSGGVLTLTRTADEFVLSGPVKQEFEGTFTA